jgi:tetratricopeptide (TPR) repeat protein
LIVVGAVRALLDIHRYKEALEYADRLRGKSKWALENLNYRGIALWQQGDHEAAMAMFEEARAMATKAKQLSDLCWDKASLGAALEQALLDCDAALAMESSYQFALDSKGFTLLRLGRLEDSLSVYDKALSISPTKTAFYGRGVARTRLGSTEEGLRDIRIAQILDPVVGEMFRGYGITP